MERKKLILHSFDIHLLMLEVNIEFVSLNPHIAIIDILGDKVTILSNDGMIDFFTDHKDSISFDGDNILGGFRCIQIILLTELHDDGIETFLESFGEFRNVPHHIPNPNDASTLIQIGNLINLLQIQRRIKLIFEGSHDTHIARLDIILCDGSVNAIR